MEKLKEFLSKKLGVQPQYITPEKTLEDLGADSLDRVEILMEVEDEFGIKNISDSEAAKVVTVLDMYNLIKEKNGDREEAV